MPDDQTTRPTRRRQPTHHGEILRADVLLALQLSVSETARQLRVPRQSLHRILSGRSAVTPEMALRLGKFCGNGPDLWLCMQQAHDLWRAQQQVSAELDKIPEHVVR
jgi:addiction module HigA family antidote